MANNTQRKPDPSGQTAFLLPYEDGLFDAGLALLVVNFIPDAKMAASEMRRVTRSGGIIATAMWDNTGRNELMNAFWAAALALIQL
jgi:ubiquinone/menaquinone biosynthesis C-methylase UbiE